MREEYVLIKEATSPVSGVANSPVMRPMLQRANGSAPGGIFNRTAPSVSGPSPNAPGKGLRAASTVPNFARMLRGAASTTPTGMGGSRAIAAAMSGSRAIAAATPGT